VSELGAFFSKHWAWLSSDPGAALTLAIAVAGATFALARLLYQRTVSIKDAEISFLTKQREDYRDKLGGATPAEAKARIDALEAHVQSVTGVAWPSLSSVQIDQLAEMLRVLPPRIMRIRYGNPLARVFAENLAEAFVKAGWPRSSGAKDEPSYAFHCGPAVVTLPGLHVWTGSKEAPVVKRAISDVTRLPVELVVPPYPVDSLWITIGIRVPDGD
jgi:hypothetical protein